MTPKQRADNMYNKMSDALLEHDVWHSSVILKACLVSVNQIIEAIECFGYAGCMFDDFETGRIVTTNDKDPSKYWQEVKTELEKL